MEKAGTINQRLFKIHSTLRTHSSFIVFSDLSYFIGEGRQRCQEKFGRGKGWKYDWKWKIHRHFLSSCVWAIFYTLLSDGQAVASNRSFGGPFIPSNSTIRFDDPHHDLRQGQSSRTQRLSAYGLRPR